MRPFQTTDIAFPRVDPTTLESTQLLVYPFVTTSTNFSARFLEHLPLVRKISLEVSRRQRLTDEEAEELTSQVQWRLARDDYKALREFRADSSFGTFVAVIAQRTATDLLRERLGNWRPSVLAKRTGRWAELYETLRQRDGLGRQEALVELARRGFAVVEDEADRLEAAWVDRPGRRFVGAESLLGRASDEPSPEHRALAREEQNRRRWALGVLAEACGTLPEMDRWLLEQFYGGATAEQLTRLLPDRPDRRRLFYRIEKLRDRLRLQLETAGLGRETVRELFRSGWAEITDDDRL